MGKRFGSTLELQQTSAPGSPVPGSTLLYSKTDGRIYTKTASGETSVGTVEQAFTFSFTGPLTTLSGAPRLPIVGGTYQISSIAAMVAEAPTGSSIILDVNKNGTTIFGTQANRPTISAESTAASVGAFSVSSVTTGDYVTVDVDQVGSSTPGTHLTVVINLLRTSS